MSELKSCPFCGGEAMKRYGYDIHKVGCSNVNCDIYEIAKYPEDWNTRSEGTLTERVKELESAIEEVGQYILSIKTNAHNVDVETVSSETREAFAIIAKVLNKEK